MSSKQQKEEVIAVKSFPFGTTATSEILFNTIVEECCESILTKIYAVMVDTTAGKESGVNKSLRDFFCKKMGYGIHILEYLRYVNETYFTHVVSLIEGKKKDPGTMEDEAFLNKIKTTEMPKVLEIPSCDDLPKIFVAGVASVFLKEKIGWFAEQKGAVAGLSHNFRTNQ